MTVISAMKFSPEKGAIISDEQSSTYYRKYDIAQKIHTFKVKGVSAAIGGSGNADFLYKIRFLAKKKFDEERVNGDYDSYNFISNFGSIINYAKEETLNGLMIGNYNITLKQFQTGMIESTPINPQIHQQMMQGVNEMNKQLNSGILCLTYDGSTEIYLVGSDSISPRPVARPYECIGSGSDLADPELLDFVKRIPRDQRNDIDPVDGLTALLLSTQRATELNTGVGGTPYLCFMDKHNLITPDSQSIAVAGHVVKGLKGQYLPKEFCKEAIQTLLIDNEGLDSARQVRKDMERAATDRDGLIGYLLGE